MHVLRELYQKKGTEQMRILIVGGVAGGASVAARGQETGCPV